MDGESLGSRDRIDVRCKLRRRLGGNLHGGDLAAENAGAERAGEAAGAAGRQHVVGAGYVVAEGGRAIATDEDAAGGRTPSASRAASSSKQLKVLRGEGVGEFDRVAEIGDLDQRQWRIGDISRSAAACSSPSATASSTPPRPPRRPAGSRRRARPGRRDRGPPTRDLCRRRQPPSAPREPARSRCRQSGDGALGLAHPGVAWAGDHVDRADRLGAMGEREDRLGAAHRVDLVDPTELGGGKTRGLTMPSGPGGEASAIRSTPATLAGIAHIKTLDG